jgi:hypothetical protein
MQRIFDPFEQNRHLSAGSVGWASVWDFKILAQAHGGTLTAQ